MLFPTLPISLQRWHSTGAVFPFTGQKIRNVVLEDSKVIQIRFNKDSIEEAKKHSITFKLDELDLTTRLDIPACSRNF